MFVCMDCNCRALHTLLQLLAFELCLHAHWVSNIKGMKDGIVLLIWHVKQWIVVAVCTSSATSTSFCHYKILHRPLQHHCYNPSTNSVVTLFCKLHSCNIVLVGDGNSCGCEYSKEVYYNETCLHLLPEVVGGVCRVVWTIWGWWHKLSLTQGVVFSVLS
jgi:hypothetical protein